jgi:hypothetical protein
MRRRCSQHPVVASTPGTQGVGVLLGGGYYRSVAGALFAMRPYWCYSHLPTFCPGRID